MPVNQTCPENEENPANKAGWVKVKLGDICSYDLGKTPKRDNPAYWKKEAGSVPWVKIADMSEHSVITETSEKISEFAFREVFRGQIVPAGTLLMSFKLTIGRVAYLGIPACHNEAIISIYPKEEVDKYYLGYFLSQVNYSGIFDRAVKGNTLNKKKIARIPVLLPPLPEQQRISTLLGSIQKAIDLERRCEASLTTIKRAAMHVVFNPANKVGWVKVKLGDICSYDLGKTPERDNPAYWKKEEGSVPWVKIADMSEHCVITETSEKISELAFHEVFRGRIVPAGTLLMSFKLTIGRIAYLGIPACHNEAIISIYPKEGVDKYYLGYFLSQVNYSGIFDRAVKGNTLNKGKIDRIPILLPPLHEQQEIVDFLTTLDQKLDIHRRKRACLENIFRLFLHNLTRGTLRFTELPEGCF
ncbi:MAG: restriction endonuclease subunit S [Acetobacter sp.]|nr:restriction endonuclease subunit S [Acetobacter sp.]